MSKFSRGERVSLNASTAEYSEAVLVRFSHSTLEEPIYVTTSDKDQLSKDPDIIGINSTWPDNQNHFYLFVSMKVTLPDKDPATAAYFEMTIDSGDSRAGEILCSTIEPIDVDIGVVYESSPNKTKSEWRNFKTYVAEPSGTEAVIKAAGPDVMNEPFPSGRMSRPNHPGLFN